MTETAAYAFELIAIDKRFGAVEANRAVTIRVRPGAVTAIVGENGAGKSTAMNIAFGLYRPDAGEIRVGGKPVSFGSPADAIACGIGMVHQHFKLVDTFGVLENVVLGAEDGWFLGKALAEARRHLKQLADEYGLAVPLEAKVGDLPLGQRQRVEILKALIRGAKVLILDEPTAVLTEQESQALFGIIRTLTERGVAVVLISHKLKDVLAVADDIFVLRAGTVVAACKATDTNEETLAELMIGQELRQSPVCHREDDGQIVLAVDHLSLIETGGRRVLDDISLNLTAGRIVGLAGVAGNGQNALLAILAGLKAPTSGSLTIDGHHYDHRTPPTPSVMRAHGIGYIPEDRHRFAMAPPLSAAETILLGRQRDKMYTDKFGRLDMAAAAKTCDHLMDDLDIRPPDPALRAFDFSGGNQQKLVVGRETAAPLRLLLAGQPSRGLDIGATNRIHERLLALRDKGTAVLLVSSDLDEILALSDVVYAIGAGKIIGRLLAHEADARTLGLMMGHAWQQEA